MHIWMSPLDRFQWKSKHAGKTQGGLNCKMSTEIIVSLFSCVEIISQFVPPDGSQTQTAEHPSDTPQSSCICMDSGSGSEATVQVTKTCCLSVDQQRAAQLVSSE